MNLAVLNDWSTNLISGMDDYGQLDYISINHKIPYKCTSRVRQNRIRFMKPSLIILLLLFLQHCMYTVACTQGESATQVYLELESRKCFFLISSQSQAALSSLSDEH